MTIIYSVLIPYTYSISTWELHIPIHRYTDISTYRLRAAVVKSKKCEGEHRDRYTKISILSLFNKSLLKKLIKFQK